MIKFNSFKDVDCLDGLKWYQLKLSGDDWFSSIADPLSRVSKTGMDYTTYLPYYMTQTFFQFKSTFDKRKQQQQQQAPARNAGEF